MTTPVENTSITPRLLALGDAAWTIEFGNAIEPALHSRVLGFCAALAEARDAGDGRFAGVLEVCPTFRSATVHYEPLHADAQALGRDLLALAATGASVQVQGTRWHLPVCFEGDCAPDLEGVARATARSPAEVKAALTRCTLSVYMIGFLPGFPYLGDLPPELALPRLANPRKVVPSRSVAIAGRMAAVYPWESPGGWHLVGRTAARLFDGNDATRPALLAPGDQVLWRAVDRAGHDALERDAAAGRLPREWLQDPGGRW